MLDPKIKARIAQQSQLPTHDDCEVKKKTASLSALERFIWDQEPVDDGEFREQLKAAIIESREAEAERAQPLVELLEYLEQWFNENPLSGRIHKALTKYNNPK